MGRNDLQYVDEARRLSLFVEPLANYSDIVLDMSSIPDLPGPTRAEVVDRLRRAFTFAGWTMIEGTDSTGPEDV
jgi:hypothetical protein